MNLKLITMKTNVSIIEVIVRLVITMVLAIAAVYTDLFIFMIASMVVLVTAIAQWCPIYHFIGRNKHLGH